MFETNFMYGQYIQFVIRGRAYMLLRSCDLEELFDWLWQ